MQRIQYEIDLSNFQQLTEETCYWIGFFAADGCIFDYGNGNVGITIALNEKDKSHLEKFQKYIKDIRPLYYQENKKTYTLTIKRRDIYELFIKYGLVPAKSNILKPPAFLTDEALIKSWIRGYIDGDGSLAITTTRKDYLAFEVGIVGTKEVLEFIRPYTKSQAKLYQKQGQNSLALTLQGNHLVHDFINWLYKDVTIYLDRKFETFNTMNNLYESFYKERTRKNVLSEETVLSIIKTLLTSTKSMKQISEDYGVCYDTIKTINSGKYHHKNYMIYPLRKNIQQNLENL